MAALATTATKPASPPTTLRDFQNRALLSLLNLNHPSTSSSSNSSPNPTGPALPTWKVLILDSRSQDILSTALRVQDLRATGVTLHMQLHADSRPALPDVPAVYFVSPSRENIVRIAKDMEKGLYEGYYLNFTSAVPRSLLEELAGLVAENGTDALVEQVSPRFEAICF